MVVSVVAGLRNMSILRLDGFRIMRRSRKLPLLSYVRLSFMFVCTLFMYVLMRSGFVRLVSYMFKMLSTYLVQILCFLCQEVVLNVCPPGVAEIFRLL